MNNKKRLAAIAALAVGMVTLFAGSASTGQTWGPVSSYYNSIKRSTADGEAIEQYNAYITNLINTYDNKADGNTVYTKSQIRWYRWSVNCNCYIWTSFGSRIVTPETSSENHIGVQWDEDSSAISAEFQSWTCVQLGWPVPDSCSSSAYAQVPNYR
jgi:hypothetical protein